LTTKFQKGDLKPIPFPLSPFLSNMTNPPSPRPPAVDQSPVKWLRQNLFNTWYNGILTLILGGFILQVVVAGLTWIATKAKWAVIGENLPLLLVGRYPPEQSWRLWLVLLLAIGLPVSIWVGQRQRSPRMGWIYAFGATIGISWLLGGGFGLVPVENGLWNGLLLTLLAASISTVLAFPLGVLLALGRQSTLPILRIACTIYIELVRGLPLIGILFMAQFLLPLLLPGDWRLDRLARAIAGLILFNAAYLAETVRGGLQSLPRGQIEAAKVLGLSAPLRLYLIVLPQAIRMVIPAIVGQFIAMFKDTSLLALFALSELTGIARSVLAQPDFIGRYAEVYLFIGLIYWIVCFTLSQISRKLEVRG
jgi:general L-amino acid transport system permease protein